MLFVCILDHGGGRNFGKICWVTRQGVHHNPLFVLFPNRMGFRKADKKLRYSPNHSIIVRVARIWIEKGEAGTSYFNTIETFTRKVNSHFLNQTVVAVFVCCIWVVQTHPSKSTPGGWQNPLMAFEVVRGTAERTQNGKSL